MSLSLAQVTTRISNTKLTPEERLNAIEKLNEVDILEAERRFMLISRIIKEEISRVLTLTGDELNKEWEIFTALLRTLGLLSEKSNILAEKYTAVLLDILHKQFQNLSRELLIEILMSTKYALRKNPWKVFEFNPILRSLLERFPEDYKVILTILQFIGEVSWEIPYIIYDFEKELRLWLNSGNSDLRNAVVDTLTKAGKRSFYAVKSFIEELIDAPDLAENERILAFVTTTPIPVDRLDLAQKVIDVIENEFLSPVAPKEKKILGITQWAFLVRRGELKDLQQSFLERIIAELNIETDDDIREALIDASVIPSWNIKIDLQELVDLLISIIKNPAESDKVRISAIKGLTHIAALRYTYADNFGLALVNVLEEGTLSPDVKETVLNAIDFVIRVVRHPEVIRRINSQLIKTMTDITEQMHYLLVNAAKILVSSAKRYPDLMAENISELKDEFLSITDWTIRDYIVRIVGETLRRIDSPNHDGIQVLLEALKDDLLAPVALEYFHFLSFKHPKVLSRYIPQLYDFIDMIRKLEKELLEEQKIEEYYMFVETPLRNFIKSLVNIANADPNALKDVIDLLIHTAKTERNEIILRDIADILDTLTVASPELREYILSQDLPDSVKEKLGKSEFRLVS